MNGHSYTRRAYSAGVFLCCLGVLAACVGTDTSSALCGPNDVATRLSVETIDTLSNEQVKDILAKNEALEKRGCAVPNRS